jgi:hypothetical protein
LIAITLMYPTKRLIHVFLDNARYHHAVLVQEWLAKPGFFATSTHSRASFGQNARRMQRRESRSIGIAPCCPRAAPTGHDTAAPPSRLRTSLRLMGPPISEEALRLRAGSWVIKALCSSFAALQGQEQGPGALGSLHWIALYRPPILVRGRRAPRLYVSEQPP